MSMKIKIVMSGVILMMALASAYAWYHHREHTYRMVNVGGEKNQCECSKRIER